MMIYQIEVFYSTGDSLGCEDTSTVLPMAWKNLDNAKLALRRIKEHYAWYQYENDPPYMQREKAPEPEWHKGEKYDSTIKLMLDNGKEVKFGAPWCGYFERLQSAEILSADPDMKFTV